MEGSPAAPRGLLCSPRCNRRLPGGASKCLTDQCAECDCKERQVPCGGTYRMHGLGQNVNPGGAAWETRGRGSFFFLSLISPHDVYVFFIYCISILPFFLEGDPFDTHGYPQPALPTIPKPAGRKPGIMIHEYTKDESSCVFSKHTPNRNYIQFNGA